MKVLITRPRAQATDLAEKLLAAGFEPIFFPVIEIRPVKNNAELEQALGHMKEYSWVIFTSTNAVSAVFSLTPTPLPQGEGQSSSLIPTPLSLGEGQSSSLIPTPLSPGEGQSSSLIPTLLPQGEGQSSSLIPTLLSPGEGPGEFPSPGGRGARGEGARGEGVRVAAVGAKTSAALRKQGIDPDFVPEEFVGANILAGLGEVRGRRILLPRADLARPELPEALRRAGAIVQEIVVYHTLPAEENPQGLKALQAGVDFITFTSPSTVQNFMEAARRSQLDPFHLPNAPTFACIGPVTAEAARQAGFEGVVTAQESTVEGLVEKIAKVNTETGKEGKR